MALPSSPRSAWALWCGHYSVYISRNPLYISRECKGHIHTTGHSHSIWLCVRVPSLERQCPLEEHHKECNKHFCNALGRGQFPVWSDHDQTDGEANERTSLKSAQRGPLTLERALAVIVFSQNFKRKNRKTFQFALKQKWDAQGYFPSKITKQTPIKFHPMLWGTENFWFMFAYSSPAFAFKNSTKTLYTFSLRLHPAVAHHPSKIQPLHIPGHSISKWGMLCHDCSAVASPNTFHFIYSFVWPAVLA